MSFSQQPNFASAVRFTLRERVIKNYTVADAVKAAKVFLADKGLSANISNMTHIDHTTPITLERLNDISERIIIDSM